MRVRLTAVLLLGAALACVSPALGQAKREDAIWARSTNGAVITLDGHLSEPAWAFAESTIIRYGRDSGIPGSGFQYEGGKIVWDSTYATLKFRSPATISTCRRWCGTARSAGTSTSTAWTASSCR